MQKDEGILVSFEVDSDEEAHSKFMKVCSKTKEGSKSIWLNVLRVFIQHWSQVVGDAWTKLLWLLNIIEPYNHTPTWEK